MKKRVCILYGGTSYEREISIKSKELLYGSSTRLGHQVLEIDAGIEFEKLIQMLITYRPDCVLNALHGGAGEDGNLQALLNFMKIPYTHSGVTASSVAMDKFVSSLIFQDMNIPTAKKAVVKKLEDISGFEYPYVIKPLHGGSSVGVYIIHNEKDLQNVKWVYNDEILVEDYIPGKEITVGIWNGKALATTEICFPEDAFYDYEYKYSAGLSNHILPARIPDDIENAALRYSELAYTALGCRGIARADFRYHEKENKLYILEMNTQPGMTATSLFPEQVLSLGISMDELVSDMIEGARCD